MDLGVSYFQTNPQMSDNVRNPERTFRHRRISWLTEKGIHSQKLMLQPLMSIWKLGDRWRTLTVFFLICLDGKLNSLKRPASSLGKNIADMNLYYMYNMIIQERATAPTCLAIVKGNGGPIPVYDETTSTSANSTLNNLEKGHESVHPKHTSPRRTWESAGCKA